MYIDKRTYKDRQEYQRNYQHKWKQKIRDAAIKQLGGCCTICGSVLFLHIHHQDPTNKIDHRVCNMSKERRDAELAKCILLCSTHHRRWHVLYRLLVAGEFSALKPGEIVRYGLQEFMKNWKPANV